MNDDFQRIIQVVYFYIRTIFSLFHGEDAAHGKHLANGCALAAVYNDWYLYNIQQDGAGFFSKCLALLSECQLVLYP
jgi:hypothetical protein